MQKYWLIALFGIIITLPMKSQGNLPYADDRRFHFGFLLGTNTFDFGVKLSHEPDAQGRVYMAETSGLQPGFSAGLIGDMRLNRYFNLRITPTIHFIERTLTYRVEGEEGKHKESIFSIPMTVPLHLKYSAERLGNYRPYLLVGGGILFDFARDQEKNILLKPFDTYIEFGVGCDLYFSFFKLAPELKFAIGLNNALTSVEERKYSGFEPQYTNAISKLTTRMLTLTFNFE